MRRRALRAASPALLAAYLVWLLFATLSPASPATTGPVAVNLVPLRRIDETLALGSHLQTVRLLAGNVLVFVPFGVLFAVATSRVGTRRAPVWLPTLLAGAVLSAGIELAQLAISIAVGYAYRDPDIDDVLLNVAGVALGLALLTAWERRRERAAGRS